MIRGDVEVKEHRPVYKRIDLAGRKRTITKADWVASGAGREPDPHFYTYNDMFETWVLKEK